MCHWLCDITLSSTEMHVHKLLCAPIVFILEIVNLINIQDLFVLKWDKRA